MLNTAGYPLKVGACLRHRPNPRLSPFCAYHMQVAHIIPVERCAHGSRTCSFVVRQTLSFFIGILQIGPAPGQAPQRPGLGEGLEFGYHVAGRFLGSPHIAVLLGLSVGLAI